MTDLRHKARYGFLWFTLAFFAISFAGHWTLAWFAYVQEAREQGSSPQFRTYLTEVGRDTLENWQSEFLQLMWQVAGLAILLHVGSPQSKEGTERLEEKLDLLLKQAGLSGRGALIDEQLRREPEDGRADREDAGGGGPAVEKPKA